MFVNPRSRLKETIGIKPEQQLPWKAVTIGIEAIFLD